MKTIYKYSLAVEDLQNISVPLGAEFLSVIEQEDHPVAYFLVDPSQEKFPLMFKLLGTGQPPEYLDGYSFLGTVSTFGGKLVWHIFAKETPAWTKRF